MIPGLDRDQQALLLTLADIQESTPKAERTEFYFVRAFGTKGQIQHKSLPDGRLTALREDVDALVEAGLFKTLRQFDGGYGFLVAPRGVALTRAIRSAQLEPTARVEAEVIRWLNAEIFSQRYPEAYERWLKAEALLQSASSAEQPTAIGHLCREALLYFVERLVQQYAPPNVPPNPANTVARLRAVLDAASVSSNTTGAFVEALVAYWGTLSDLVQRHEHGALREGVALSQEDSRRVVFYTFLVMFEVARTLPPSGPRAAA